MAQGRPSFGFALIDLPSDHEIEIGLITEPQMIHAILHNRGLGSRTKVFRATSKEGFCKVAGAYKGLGFVHLATHGSPKGLWLIGARVTWADVADQLKKIAPKLAKGDQRVLCLSCCYSRHGYEKLRRHLKGHFTGVYYFNPEEITFATAMTVWSMFYRKKTIQRPAKAIAQAINDFFGEETIVYGSV